MQKFEFTAQQLQALQTFLNRVDLKGAEVSAFNDLIAVFQHPLAETKE